MPDREMPGSVPTAWAQPTSRASATVAFRAFLRPLAIRSEKKRMKPVASRATETKVTLLMASSTRPFTGRMANSGSVATIIIITSRRVGGGGAPPPRRTVRSRMPRKNSRIMSMTSRQ